MKLFDKFLKKLKTNRNTFLTYILTLISIYILVDRVVELLFLFFSGISLSYWGPIQYTLAIACPIFAFLFSGSSSFTKSDKVKLSFMYTYVVVLYTIVISMIVQWLNEILWILLMSLPNYVGLITTSSELIKPAFTAIALYIPLTTFFMIFKFIYMKVNDSVDIRDSVLDFNGIDLSPAPKNIGPYTCENIICTDSELGKPVKIAEDKRFESTLVVGPSGTGKTTMVIEPMVARDIEKKLFFEETAKEMGFTALKTGIATLSAPFNNDFLNKHFNLNMLKPVESKLKIYKTYMKKMIIDSSSDDIKYKNLGITAISPDYTSIENMIKIANNFNIPYNLIDPDNPDSIGINPFTFDDPLKTAVAISSVLKSMYNTTHTDVEEAFRDNVTSQAIENLSILLKVMYPKLNDGDLPNLTDMLEMLTDFDLVEEMCRKMEYDPELSTKYKMQIAYFKKNFYRSGSGRIDTEKFVYSAVTQLDNLLRNEGVRNILCNRNDNINFDQSLENGEVTFVCTRRGDLGAATHKAFGLFFIILMQYSVLRRPGNERNRVPHFLYIDEFPDFLCKDIDAIFTLYRKYRVGTLIAAQNLEQLGSKVYSRYRQTILANCSNKLLFGGATPEDREWWSKEFGNKRKWKYKNDYNTEKGTYDQKYGGIEYGWTEYFKPDKLGSLKAKQCAYKVLNPKGGLQIGKGKVAFVDSQYKEKQKVKFFNFEKFTSGISDESDSRLRRKPKFNYGNVDFTDSNNSAEIDPIKTDTSDSSFLFDNDDAIIVDLKRGNSNK